MFNRITLDSLLRIDWREGQGKEQRKELDHCHNPGERWWGLGQSGRNGSGEKWLDYRSILKVELLEFPDGFSVGCERKRSQR